MSHCPPRRTNSCGAPTDTTQAAARQQSQCCDRTQVLNDPCGSIESGLLNGRNYNLYGMSEAEWLQLNATCFPENTGVEEAPEDGQPYNRRNGAWTVDNVSQNPPADGNNYVRRNGAWVLDPVQSDAPEDGQPYSRQDGDWVLATDVGQDLYTDTLTTAEILAIDPETAVGVYWSTDEFAEYHPYTAAAALGGVAIWQRVRIDYDADTDTFKVAVTQDGQTQNLGQELFFIANNTSALAATALDPKVFKATTPLGGNENFKEITPVKADDVIEGNLFGLNTTPAGLGDYTKIAVYGDINGVNTSAWADGATLYIDPVTSGDLTDVKPDVDAWAVAAVLKSDAVDGKLFINTIGSNRDNSIVVPAGYERQWLTADDVVLTAETFYDYGPDKGTIASDSQTGMVNDDETVALAQKWVGAPAVSNTDIPVTAFNGQLEFTIDNSSAQEKLYIEAYLADNDGNVIDSGSGLPNGVAYPQPPISVLSSPLLNSDDSFTQFAPMSGVVTTPIPIVAGQRVVYAVLVEKVGTAGAAKTFTVYCGSDHSSYIDAPFKITTDDVINESGVAGATNTDALNTLDTAVQGRMNWLNTWVPQEYQANDTVRDGEWTMVANKTTEDRPAPQPQGAPFDVYTGSSPTAAVVAKQIIFGNRYTLSSSGWVITYRIYTITGNDYSVNVVSDPLGTPIVTQIADFTADVTGWITLNSDSRLALPGTTFDLIALVSEPDPTPTEFSGNWDYQKPQNVAAPSTGQIVHASKALGQLYVSKTDNAATDRSAELATLVVGDVIEIDGGVRWNIQSISDQGTYYIFGVNPESQSALIGVNQFNFETVTATPIPRLEDVDYWLSNFAGQVQGLYIEDDSYTNIVPNNSAYGVDINLQPASISDDWDLLANTEGLGGGSGGGSGGDVFGPAGGVVAGELTAFANTTGKLIGSGEAPSDGNQYARKDGAWEQVVASGGSVTVSDTPPVSPSSGDVWLDSKTGLECVWYEDGTSNQWVSDAGLDETQSVGQIMYVESTTSGNEIRIPEMVRMTAADYGAITPEADKLYVIVG